MHRFLLAVALAFSFVVIPNTAAAQTGACFRDDGAAPLNREYGMFSGEWARHGVAINVSVDGCVTLERRTYYWCPPGQRAFDQRGKVCDWSDGNVIHSGDWASYELNAKDGQAASGRVLTASTIQRLDNPGIVLRLRTDGTLGFETLGIEYTLCRTGAWDIAQCGA